ncbi:Amidase [Exophiala dermatitidis]
MIAENPDSPSLQPWQKIHLSKKAQQAARIPQEWLLKPEDFPSEGTVDLRPVAASCGILSDRELLITGDHYDATSLAAAIAEGTYSAVEVVTAFCKRAAIGHQLCNNLTEIMFQDALNDAKRLDRISKETGKTVGPLHGLPMTFKECFHIEGYDASNGYIARTFEPSTHTTPLVEVVKANGAVVIAKTNTPQTMLVAESHNNVFGQTKNPVVSHLTCGGSSGGEGSVMAFRGSALGVGTDVGGSIRIPAAANGVYGYKPSFGILPLIGYAASGWVGANTGVPAVCGPLGHSARDLALLTRVVRDARPWTFDPAVIPRIMEIGAETRKPVVGVIHKSGTTPHPPVRRAVREAADKLSAAGIVVKDFVPPDFNEIRMVTKELFTLDALSYPRGQLEKAGEPVVPSVEKIGFWSIPRKTHEEAWALNAKKLALQKEMLDRWQKAGIDIVLAPAGPHTAVLPGDWTVDMYTVAWNAMDYPAVVIPFTKADPALDPKDEEFVPLHELDEKIQSLYDPQLMAGAPVALQLVGPRLGDEQLLNDVQTIETILKT